MTEIFSNTFLEVPYEHKDIAKSNRCFFNMTAKQWSISPSNENYDTMVQLFKIVYLKNIFENREIYKLNGAKWSQLHKSWYTYKSNIKLVEYFEDE